MTASTTSRPDRSIPALVAAAVVIAIVIGLVLLLGIARPPQLDRLADAPQPAPSAAVAWTAFDRDGSCLEVARPDGTSRSLRCDLDGGEVLAWDDEGIALSAFGPSPQVHLIDPATGEQRGGQDLDEGGRPYPGQMSELHSQHTDGTLTVMRDDTLQVIWEVEAPEGYRVWQGTTSPDGEWVAMLDSTGRLLVVPADGSAEPRIWVEEAGDGSAPVWQGTPLSSGDDAEG